MDERDEWLEGVRRWYFGGDAPAGETPDDLSWPANTGQHATPGQAVSSVLPGAAPRSDHAVPLQIMSVAHAAAV